MVSLGRKSRGGDRRAGEPGAEGQQDLGIEEKVHEQRCYKLANYGRTRLVQI